MNNYHYDEFTTPYNVPMYKEYESVERLEDGSPESTYYIFDDPADARACFKSMYRAACRGTFMMFALDTPKTITDDLIAMELNYSEYQFQTFSAKTAMNIVKLFTQNCIKETIVGKAVKVW